MRKAITRDSSSQAVDLSWATCDASLLSCRQVPELPSSISRVRPIWSVPLTHSVFHYDLIHIPPLPHKLLIYFFPPPLCFPSVSLSTFFTIFCSSIKNALTIRSLTQLLHLDPPYARCTVLLGRLVVAYSRGRSAGICANHKSSAENHIVVVNKVDNLVG